jgi:hypothetical protein
MENTLSKFKSFAIESGKRILTVMQYGAKTAKESYPFGFDSAPLADYTAIFLDTANKDESIIIGYINKNQIAKLGESRMYALGSSGDLLGFVYCREDGTTAINGDEFSAVRFQELKTQIDLLQNQINSQWPLIASGIATGGGVYTPTNVSIDLTNSESPTVKLK